MVIDSPRRCRRYQQPEITGTPNAPVDAGAFFVEADGTLTKDLVSTDRS